MKGFTRNVVGSTSHTSCRGHCLLFALQPPFRHFSCDFFMCTPTFVFLTYSRPYVIQTPFVFQTRLIASLFLVLFCILCTILFAVHLALRVCYFCNNTQLQHLPPSPQEAKYVTRHFMTQNRMLMKHLRRQCKRTLCWCFGRCQLHYRVHEAPFLDLFFQQSSYGGDEAHQFLVLSSSGGGGMS